MKLWRTCLGSRDGIKDKNLRWNTQWSTVLLSDSGWLKLWISKITEVRTPQSSFGLGLALWGPNSFCYLTRAAGAQAQDPSYDVWITWLWKRRLGCQRIHPQSQNKNPILWFCGGLEAQDVNSNCNFGDDFPASKIGWYAWLQGDLKGRLKANGLQGISLSHSLAQIDPLDGFVGLKTPWSHYLRSPLIWASKRMMLVVLWIRLWRHKIITKLMEIDRINDAITIFDWKKSGGQSTIASLVLVLDDQVGQGWEVGVWIS